MEKALVNLALRNEEDKEGEGKAAASPPPQKPASPQTTAPSAPSAAAQVPTALKGVSQSLLDRVRRGGRDWFLLFLHETPHIHSSV